METISRERKSYYDVYVANDGTEFRDREECKKYEESAVGVLMAKLRPIISETNEYDVSGMGCEDSNVWVAKPSTQDDVDTIMQLYLAKEPYMMKEEYKETVELRRAIVQRALDENDVLFIGRGCDYDSFWFIGTRNSIKEKLDSFLNAEKKDDNA
jgi:hypothetical protein